MKRCDIEQLQHAKTKVVYARNTTSIYRQTLQVL